jgi:hypothetical protein
MLKSGQRTNHQVTPLRGRSDGTARLTHCYRPNALVWWIGACPHFGPPAREADYVRRLTCFG